MADMNTAGQVGAGAFGAVLAASGVPLPVVLATTLGALIVVSNTKRTGWNRKAIVSSVLAFCLALALGYVGGNLLAWFALRTFADIPALPVQILGSLVCAMYGQKVFLPKIVARIGGKIDGGEL